jgi:ceramide kinase
MAMISYGYFGDLMVHSERLRWLGPKRYDISGIHTFLNNNAYKGKIDFVEETRPELKTDPRRVNDYCYVDCGTCNAAQREIKNQSSSRPISKVTFSIFFSI